MEPWIDEYEGKWIQQYGKKSDWWSRDTLCTGYLCDHVLVLVGRLDKVS